MRDRQSWMVVMLLLVWTALYLVALKSALGMMTSHAGEHAIYVGRLSRAQWKRGTFSCERDCRPRFEMTMSGICFPYTTPGRSERR